jgi:predicted nucleic acid-binding protein
LASEQDDRLVVADTGPLHYLVLIGQVDILPRLFGTITIPSVVRDELSCAETPPAVRAWMASPPAWLKVEMVVSEDVSGKALDAGERAVLSLAGAICASLVLMDDRSGVGEARRRGFAAIGTLGILDLGATRGLVRLSDAFLQLRATNFRYPGEMMNALLAQQSHDS